MYLLRIAFRSLGRAPARTALGIAAVALAVLVVILMKGLVDGILQTMEDGTVRLSAGHVRVVDGEYRIRERLLSLQYPVDGVGGEGYGPLAAALAELPEVTQVAPRLRFGALVSRGDDLRNVVVVAGEPAIERDLLRLDRYLAAGRPYRAGRREALLGRVLLDRLGLEVGDRFTLVFSTALGALRGYTFTVVGALESGLAALDDGSVYVPLDVAQEALDMGPAVTEVLLLAERADRAPAVLERVQALLEARGAAERYVAVPWYEHNAVTQFLQVGRGIYDGLYVGLLVLASFVPVNTMAMIVNERRREIGMLGALGLRPRQIQTLFVLEGGLSAAAGSLLGAAGGAALLWVLSRVGIPLPGVENLGPELMYPSTLYPVLNATVVAYAPVLGVLVMVAAAYVPARQAARMQPTEALRA